MEYKKSIQLKNKSYNHKSVNNNNKNLHENKKNINKKTYHSLINRKSGREVSKMIVLKKIIPQYSFILSNKKFDIQLFSNYYKYSFFEENFISDIIKKSMQNNFKMSFLYDIQNFNIFFYGINLKYNNRNYKNNYKNNFNIFRYFL